VNYFGLGGSQDTLIIHSNNKLTQKQIEYNKFIKLSIMVSPV
jgi:hypothetical protein